jgi:hypothetical protein
VDNWAQYLGWAVEAGLIEAVYTTLNNSIGSEDVVLFALHAFSTWIEKDVERATVEIHALNNLPLVLLDVARRHGRNVVLVSKSVNLFASLPDEVLSEKALTPLLGMSLAEVMAGCHEHGTHAVWQFGSGGIVRVLSIIAHHAVEWQAVEALQKILLRLVEIVERNASHWEVFFLLQIVALFRVLLVQHVEPLVTACCKVIMSHTAGGTECTDRRVCKPDYEQSPSWGSALDVALKILTSCCFLPEHETKDVVDFVMTAGRALLNSYTVGRKLEVQARACLDKTAIETMASGSVPRACMELVLSHREYRALVMKAVQLLLLTSFAPEIPLDDVYRNGAGALALLDFISEQRTKGLGSKEANNAEEHFQRSAAALLMMLTRERKYKMGILGRGYEQIWALVQSPDTMVLGLTALCHLSDNSPDAQEWLRKRGTDKDIVQLFAEPMDLSLYKVRSYGFFLFFFFFFFTFKQMVLDILSEMQSATLTRLPELIGVAQLVAIAYYFTPRLSDTEITRDNTRTVMTFFFVVM